MSDSPGDIHSAFVELALRFRAEGALRVRDGGLEVVFPPREREEQPEPPAAPLSRHERARLEELETLAAYAEEMP